MLFLSVQARFQPLKKRCIVSLDSRSLLKEAVADGTALFSWFAGSLCNPTFPPLWGTVISDAPDVSYGRLLKLPTSSGCCLAGATPLQEPQEANRAYPSQQDTESCTKS